MFVPGRWIPHSFRRATLFFVGDALHFHLTKFTMCDMRWKKRAHILRHIHTHTLRLMKSRVRCIKYIHMRIYIIVKKPQPDSILHSYSAPIDRSLKKYIQPTISTHYRDKEKKKPFWLLPIQCCVYVHKMGLNEVKSIDFRHRTCTKSIVSVIMLDDRSQNGVYNKFIRHFGRFYSLRSLFRVYTSIYWKHRVSRRRQL